MAAPPHPADVKAAAVAAMLSGIGISECARRYQLPKGTLARWKDEATVEPWDSTATERHGTPPWLPEREDDKYAELDALVHDYLHGQRVVVAWLTYPDHLSHASPAQISAIVAVHDALGSRVAGLAEILGVSAVQRPPPALTEVNGVVDPAD